MADEKSKPGRSDNARERSGTKDGGHRTRDETLRYPRPGDAAKNDVLNTAPPPPPQPSKKDK